MFSDSVNFFFVFSDIFPVTQLSCFLHSSSLSASPAFCQLQLTRIINFPLSSQYFHTFLATSFPCIHRSSFSAGFQIGCWKLNLLLLQSSLPEPKRKQLVTEGVHPQAENTQAVAQAENICNKKSVSKCTIF